MRRFYILPLTFLILTLQTRLYAQTAYTGEQSADDEARVVTILQAKHKIVFDVSALLSYGTPANLSQIQDSLKGRCPTSVQIIFESPDYKRFNAWVTHAEYKNEFKAPDNYISRFHGQLIIPCPGGRVPWNGWLVHWLCVNEKKPRILLYLLY